MDWHDDDIVDARSLSVAQRAKLDQNVQDLRCTVNNLIDNILTHKDITGCTDACCPGAIVMDFIHNNVENAEAWIIVMLQMLAEKRQSSQEILAMLEESFKETP